jgi:hypothetical protein
MRGFNLNQVNASNLFLENLLKSLMQPDALIVSRKLSIRRTHCLCQHTWLYEGRSWYQNHTLSSCSRRYTMNTDWIGLHSIQLIYFRGAILCLDILQINGYIIFESVMMIITCKV